MESYAGLVSEASTNPHRSPGVSLLDVTEEHQLFVELACIHR